MLTGKVIKPHVETVKNPGEFITKLVMRLEEPVVRSALKSAMRHHESTVCDGVYY